MLPCKHFDDNPQAGQEKRLIWRCFILSFTWYQMHAITTTMRDKWRLINATKWNSTLNVIEIHTSARLAVVTRQYVHPQTIVAISLSSNKPTRTLNLRSQISIRPFHTPHSPPFAPFPSVSAGLHVGHCAPMRSHSPIDVTASIY